MDRDKAKKLEGIKKLLNDSPYYKHVKIEVSEFNDTGCTVKMEIENEHTNLYGIAHGGALASLGDVACGASLATFLEEGEFAVTQNIMMNYFKPVQKGIVTARGRLINRGKRSAVLEADIHDESGELVAHAQTTNAIRKVS